jgi:hypothetical protein
MTVLLTLLKQYKPDPCYDLLPKTGAGLLPIDGRDFPTCQRDVPMEPEATVTTATVATDETAQSAATETNDGESERLPKKRKRPPRLAKASELEFGKSIYFGLENGLLGTSPGLYFKDQNLVMFAALNKNHPHLVPRIIKQQVIKFSNMKL